MRGGALTARRVALRRRRRELGEPALEQAPLRVIADQRQRPQIGVARLVGAAQTAQQLTLGRMQVVIVVELEAIDDLEAGLGAVLLGDGHGAAELDDRGAGDAAQLAVQGGDLRPITLIVSVQGRDRGLQDVRSAAVQRQRPVEHDAAFLDLRGVPERPVLVCQQHELPVSRSRPAARVVQQHHREQPVHLGLVGHQLGERPAETQRLGRQVAAGRRRRVAGVEDQVHHREHGRETIGQQVVGRHAKRDPGRLDLAFGADQALGHGRLADQERLGDLGRGQAAERPQGERDLGVERECRVTAGEYELEALVLKSVFFQGVLHRLRYVELARLLGEGAVAPDPVDRAVTRGGHEPCRRVIRGAVARPALRGDRKRLLRGFLGELEVAEEADQCGKDLAPLVAEGLLERHAARTVTTRRVAAPRWRRPSAPPGSWRRARSRRRGRRPRRTDSRRRPP